MTSDLLMHIVSLFMKTSNPAMEGPYSYNNGVLILTNGKLLRANIREKYDVDNHKKVYKNTSFLDF